MRFSAAKVTDFMCNGGFVYGSVLVVIRAKSTDRSRSMWNGMGNLSAAADRTLLQLISIEPY